jgi:UDP-N-acetylglucosamine 2-epimerase (non-hydrolysing)
VKVASVVGTRPQFVKAAALSPEIRRRAKEILIHTGQHYDEEMSKVFFESLHLPEPDYDLGVGSGSHGQQTGLMLAGVEEVLDKEKPDSVLVYGDTNSTLAGALAAAKLHIPVGHVEAGLRSNNRTMPEEINRIIVDHISTSLFAPTKIAVENLRREGIEKGVHLVGDVMYDLAMRSANSSKTKEILKEMGLRSKGYLLATVHRPANTDNRSNLEAIIEALQECGRPVVFPVHPRTAKAIRASHIFVHRSGGNIARIEPVDYLTFICLLTNAEKVITDSGGVQKEAYFFGIPCITLREETEWPETVETGWNLLVGARKKEILRAVRKFEPKGRPAMAFGDGHAAERIARLVAGG